jgi:hypothetical protein
MTPPAHRVTVHHLATRVVHVSQHFSLAYAQAVLAAYVAHGWTGFVEALP